MKTFAWGFWATSSTLGVLLMIGRLSVRTGLATRLGLIIVPGAPEMQVYFMAGILTTLALAALVGLAAIAWCVCMGTGAKIEQFVKDSQPKDEG